MDRFQKWEQAFGSTLAKMTIDQRKRCGGLIPLLPSHSEWLRFVKDAKDEWNILAENLYRFPLCIIALYAGVVFFEYQHKATGYWAWHKLAEILDVKSAPSTVRIFNTVFLKSFQNLGFSLRFRGSMASPDDSVTYSIGLLPSLWQDFIRVCQLVASRADWESYSDEEWQVMINKLPQVSKIIKAFVLENRSIANGYIRELLALRCKALSGVIIKNLFSTTFLRPEYLMRAETEQFLGASAVEILPPLELPCELIWNEQLYRLSLFVPGIAQNCFPAIWNISDITQVASTSPDEIVLNARIFEANLFLHLHSSHGESVQEIRGLSPWVLFDVDNNGKYVSIEHTSELLPASRYVLICSKPICEVSRTGLDDSQCVVNEELEFEDGGKCYLTRFFPMEFSKFCWKCGSTEQELIFGKKDREFKKFLDFVKKGRSLEMRKRVFR